MSSSQVVAPLRPLVVTLDVGMVVRRPLIGLDTAAYRHVRLGRDFDQQQLADRAREIDRLRGVITQDSLAAQAQAKELGTTRLDLAKCSADLGKQEWRTRQALSLPTQKPLLIDSHTWLGVGAGAALTLLLVLKTFAHP